MADRAMTSAAEKLAAEFTLPEGNFMAVDTMAVELEVAALLHALVRQHKPNLVIECGSGKGYASVFIADALKRNSDQEGAPRGGLATYEQDMEYAEQAAERLVGLPAQVVHGYSVDHDGPDPDLVFIDSLGGEPRERDMDHWFACAARPLIVIHDANGYEASTFARGEGVLLGSGRGVWIGRARA